MTVKRKRTRKASTSKPIEAVMAPEEQLEMEEVSPNAILTSMVVGAVIGAVGMILSNLKVSGTMGLGDVEVDVEKEKMGIPKYRFRRAKKLKPAADDSK